MVIEYLTEIYDLLEETISLSLSYFVNTEKRIHILYLITSMILAYYVYRKSRIKTSFFKYLFPKKIWASKSAFVDYSLFCFNSLIKILFIGPYVIIGLYIAFYVNEYLLMIFGFPTNSLSIMQTLVLYTIALTIIGDFFTYIVHYAMHKIPMLWEFHKIHHSATSLNPMTQYRIHPVELIINNIRSIFVFGLITGNSNIVVSGTANVTTTGVGNGYWATSESQLNAKYIHDNDFYQSHSYVVETGLSLDKYRDILLKAAHISGTRLFGKVIKESSVNNAVTVSNSSIGAL